MLVLINDTLILTVIKMNMMTTNKQSKANLEVISRCLILLVAVIWWLMEIYYILIFCQYESWHENGTLWFVHSFLFLHGGGVTQWAVFLTTWHCILSVEITKTHSF